MDHTDIVEQLIADERFSSWVRQPDPQLEKHWSDWLRKYPEHAAALEDARNMVLAIEFGDDLQVQEVHEAWHKLQAIIGRKQSEASSPPETRASPGVPASPDGRERPEAVQIPGFNWKKYIGIAAAVTVILFASVLLFKRPSYTVYTTGYGEQYRVELPDGSVVVLNSNSSLKVRSNWRKTGPREVQIRGEACFFVVHTSDDRQFLVRTDDGMQVEVLGTEFNVYERQGRQRVVLNSGSVRLRYNDMKTTNPITLKPGEMAIRRAPGVKPEKRKVNTSLYFSWTGGQLVFENTPVAEVCRLIEDNFGIRIILSDSLLNTRMFNGTFPANDAEILLKTVMTTYDLLPVRSDSVIRLIRK